MVYGTRTTKRGEGRDPDETTIEKYPFALRKQTGLGGRQWERGGMWKRTTLK